MYLFFTFSPFWLLILFLFFIGLFVVCVCAFKLIFFLLLLFPLFVYFMCSFHFIAGGVSAGRKLRSLTLELYINI